MVDGLIELHLDTVGMEAARSIVVTKFRGSGYLTGRHPFEITDAGITIYPRIESRRGNAAEAADSSINTAAAFGIPSLDAMLGGGLRPATTTMVRGAPGTGKTLLGLKFLEIGAAAQPREPGLYFGLRDGPTTLCRRAARVGIVLDAHVRAGLVDIVVLSPLPTIADAIAEKVLSAVKERGVKRLFIDGLCWFGESPAYPERAGRFFVALCNELAAMGVTTVFAHETDIQGLMGRLDNIINVGRVPRDGRVHRVISVTRARDGAGDSLPHVVSFDTEGIRVSGPLTRGEPAAGDAFGFDPHGESSRAGEGDSP
ncbi:MAG: ATPase domain-containing protein, partial [Polyangiaceae bacterium]